jgi:hypothetical protein
MRDSAGSPCNDDGGRIGVDQLKRFPRGISSVTRSELSGPPIEEVTIAKNREAELPGTNLKRQEESFRHHPAWCWFNHCSFRRAALVFGPLWR